MRKQSKITFLFVLLALGKLTSCSNCPESEKSGLDRSLIIENALTNFIMPAHEELLSDLNSLSESVLTLTESPDGQNLAAAQQAWQDARIKWAQVELYNFGPVSDFSLMTKFNNWPLNEFRIEAYLKEKTEVTVSDIAALPSNQVGFPAVEYLLFVDDALEKLQNSTGRRSMLISQVTVLQVNAGKITDEWKNTYGATFKSSSGTELGASSSLLANAYVESVLDVNAGKVSVPLGLKGDGSPQPKHVESRYAGISKELIIANLQAQKRFFNGTGKAGDLNGFDDYLDASEPGGSDPLLSQSINDQFDQAISAVESIPGTLQTAVTERPLEVNNAATELQKLIALLKTDMMSRLGLVLTFSDNDGD